MNYLTFRNLWIALFVFLAFSCQKKVPMDLTTQSIIPKPSSVIPTNSSFELNPSIEIFYDGNNEELKSIAHFFSDLLMRGTGINLKVASTIDAPKKGIYITTNENASDGKEAYEINISEDLVTVEGASPEGVFRGIQTLRQLLPASIESPSKKTETLLIATGKITDSPVYGYRGSMLDVSRHFFGVDDVKRYIDLIAAFKLNTLHLHLSDDQGWRIEIKSRPKLTEIGSQTQVGGGKGGFYTQEQYKDIVQYAADRYITIIPEIDMPGHTNAALASYPELNCDGKARELYSGIEVGFSTFCTGSEATYKFIDDVIRELAEMTTGPYIHIGGDESHVTPLEDYIPFINKVQEIVKKHGKEVIGWDEIAHAELVDNAVVQYWDKADNAKKGIDQGARVLMSPAKMTYLDMQYDSTTELGLHWASYIEVDAAYNWDPATLIPGIQKENIIGVESPLWSETITKMDDIEYMAFPRLLCHAEIGWTKTEDRNWDEFKVRLAEFCERMEAMEINYYQSSKVPWK